MAVSCFNPHRTVPNVRLLPPPSPQSETLTLTLTLTRRRHASPSLPRITALPLHARTRTLFSSSISHSPPPFPRSFASTTSTMEGTERAEGYEAPSMKLLFVEMGVGYDQHGQDVTAAAMRACKDAISSNSIPAFRRGSIPGVNSDQMKLQIKLGVPRSTQHLLDVERVKSIFPYVYFHLYKEETSDSKKESEWEKIYDTAVRLLVSRSSTEG